MAGQNQGVNMDQFEAYFRKADLDGDGRISGAEAVSFFQGSNLSKQVLAQIWMHADQSRTGFLSRQEFYNALKLVTVAQSKRDLTPDIVKAALYGPASAKIPAPQISFPAAPSSQLNTVAPSIPQAGTVVPSQNIGFRGQGVPNSGMNQGYLSQQNQSLRPQAMPTNAPRPSTGTASLDFSKGGNMGSFGTNQTSSMSSDWLGGRTGGVQTGPRATSALLSSVASRPPSQFSLSPQSMTNDSKALVVSGNGSDSVSGSSTFPGNSALQKPAPSLPNYSAGSVPTSSAIVPVSGGIQTSSKPNSLNSLSNFSMQSPVPQVHQARPSLSQSLQVSAQGPSSLVSPGLSAGVGNSSSGNSQVTWPKMKASDIQKYTKVFMEVDTDRDGRITGEQARNLFLSWRLPREVLKQVWDLSDHDSDSMLSLREFCFALYLMERYREGRPLPPALPSSVMYDETLLSMTGQLRVPHGNMAWGFGQQQQMPQQKQQQQGMPSAQPAASVPGSMPSIDLNAPKADSAAKSSQQKSGGPVLEDSFLDPLGHGDRTSVNAKSKDAAAVKQAAEPEKIILDSKEKMEFYRTMMQELVLYKSRCDNRLNEITERALADKREAESLAKKYEEKYKQVAEIASKLTIEEATFRETQERKTELHQALIKVEQGGSADGILQVRADRIQSHLEELIKALTELCKKHKIEVKSTAVIELPIGWQPGIQEGAAVWDEDWDKFEDEGFASEITVDGKIISVASNPKSADVQKEKGSMNGNVSPDSSIFVDEKPGSAFSFEDDFDNVHGEDELGRKPRDSPARQAAFDSPPREFHDLHTEKTTDADSEFHRSFDEPAWGAFDNDDVDSVWGFDTNKDLNKHEDLFGHGDFSVNPIQTGSPGADSAYRGRSPFFEDSVPSTPMSKFGSPRYSEADHFDQFSKFDSFSVHDGGFPQQPDRLTRFDSVNSSRDFGPGLSRFDSMSSSRDLGHGPGHSRFDSVGSTMDFGQNQVFTRFDSINSTRDMGQSPTLTRFDSINSTKDFGGHGFSFDDSDPFGSTGPFKASSDHRNSEKSFENWGSSF